MVKLKLDKRSVNAITKKLKAMPAKLQRKAIRATIDPEAKRLKNQMKAITPKGKRKHKNKYTKVAGSGFLKHSFSVRNTGRGTTAGRGVIVRGLGYYIFMSPNETGRRGGKGNGAVSGAKKYSRLWKARQIKVTNNLIKSLSSELTRV